MNGQKIIFIGLGVVAVLMIAKKIKEAKIVKLRKDFGIEKNAGNVTTNFNTKEVESPE